MIGAPNYRFIHSSKNTNEREEDEREREREILQFHYQNSVVSEANRSKYKFVCVQASLLFILSSFPFIVSTHFCKRQWLLFPFNFGPHANHKTLNLTVINLCYFSEFLLKSMSDFLFGITAGRPETYRSPSMTIDLLNKDKSIDVSVQNAGGSSNSKSTDFYPQFAGFGSFASIDEAMNKADFRCFAFSFQFAGFRSELLF